MRRNNLPVQYEAADDAVRAKQAVSEGGNGTGIRWTVPGRIEERITGEATPAK